MYALLTSHSISKPQSASERDDLTQLLMHLEWNIFIKLILEAVIPYLNYSFIIAEQQPACGLWNPGKIRCLHISKCWKLNSQQLENVAFRGHLLGFWFSGRCDQCSYWPALFITFNDDSLWCQPLKFVT